MTSSRLVAMRALAALALSLAAAGCSDATGARARPVTLSVTAASPAPSAAVAPFAAGPQSITLSSGGNTLVISKAQLVLSKIELAPSSAATCSGTGDDGCDDIELAPVLLDLPVDGTTKVGLSAMVPEGSYSALEAKVEAVTSGEDNAAAFLAAHPDFAGVSVRVEGTYNGAPFVYTGSAEAEIEMSFPSPVTVDAGTSNLTIDVDLSSWFKDGTGSVVDPADGANASLIADNIRRSLRAFEDDNKDGVADSH